MNIHGIQRGAKKFWMIALIYVHKAVIYKIKAKIYRIKWFWNSPNKKNIFNRTRQFLTNIVPIVC